MSTTGQTRAEVWTIRRMIKWMSEDFSKRELSSPRLDAELLVAHALSVPRVQLYMDLDRPLQQGELDQIRALVARRRKFEPVAYILGQREFYGRAFAVSPHVLIPRPDTETLVERALAIIDATGVSIVWDICAGSGAIGLSILAERPEVRCVLSDLSEEALAVARANAQSLGVAERAEFLLGDGFGPFEPGQTAGLICVNPPYVSTAQMAELSPDVREHEPQLALLAGDDGLAFYRSFLPALGPWLAAGGAALLECGRGQAENVVALAREAGLREVKIHNDLTGVGRVVELAVTAAR